MDRYQDRLGPITMAGNWSRRKNPISKCWFLPGFVAHETPQLLWLQYMWWAYDPNGLRDGDDNKSDDEHKKNVLIKQMIHSMVNALNCDLHYYINVFFIHVIRCEIQPMLLRVILIREAAPFPSLFCQRSNTLMRAPQEEHLQTSFD